MTISLPHCENPLTRMDVSKVHDVSAGEMVHRHLDWDVGLVGDSRERGGLRDET